MGSLFMLWIWTLWRAFELFTPLDVVMSCCRSCGVDFIVPSWHLARFELISYAIDGRLWWLMDFLLSKSAVWVTGVLIFEPNGFFNCKRSFIVHSTSDAKIFKFLITVKFIKKWAFTTFRLIIDCVIDNSYHGLRMKSIKCDLFWLLLLQLLMLL